MNVLCFGRFYDDIPGGMQRHVEHLFAVLRGRVDYVHLVPSRDSTAAEFTLHGFPVIRTPSLNVDGSIAISPSLFSRARRLHAQYRFDLIHLHFPDPMSHLASLALPAAIPRVITWHADILRHKVLRTFYRPLLRRALTQASAITVATPAHIRASADLSRLRDRSRIHVVPYGFDLQRFVSPHPKTAAIRAAYPGNTILTLGRHVSYKGFDVLIEAMRSLENSTRLLIGGTGPLTEQWKSLARQLGVADRVHFLGLVDEADLPAYFQACDVFCLPAVTQAEAFGIVQIEAMASGKPVVSTALGNGVDFVNQDGRTGFTVAPKNPNALADALRRLLSDQSLAQTFGRQGRQRALAEFSSEAMGRRTFEIYRQSIGAGPGGSRELA